MLQPPQNLSKQRKNFYLVYQVKKNVDIETILFEPERSSTMSTLSSIIRKELTLHITLS